MNEKLEVIKKDPRAYVIPQSVSFSKNPAEETERQMAELQEKFQRLPNLIQDKLASDETGKQILDIGRTYNLQILQLSDIARAIRSYYFGELKLEDFPLVFYKEMGINLDEAKKISQIVIQKIIQDQSQQKNYISLSLDMALKQYPETTDQLITSQPIRSRTSQDMIRPSVKNWLTDYTYNLGYDHHDSITRGNYLFQSENTKTLNSQDRQKLSYILKSFDDKTPITVNVGTKQVVFSAETMALNQPPAPAPGGAGIKSQGIELRRPETPRPISTPSYPSPRPVTAAPRPPVNPVQSSENNHPWAQVVQRPEEITPPAPKRQEFRPTPGPVRTERPVSPPVNNFNRPPVNLPTNKNISRSNIPTQSSVPPPVPDWHREERFSIKPELWRDEMDNVHVAESRPLRTESGLSFSSPQKLPYEKEQEAIHRPAPPAPEAPRPMRISPVTHDDYDHDDLPGNVVNLRE